MGPLLCPASARPPIAREDPGFLLHLHKTTPRHTHNTHNQPPPPTPTHTHTSNLPLFGSRPKRREPSEAAALLTPARQAPRWSGELASATPPVGVLHVYCQAPRWGGSARATRRRSLRRGPTATSAAGWGEQQGVIPSQPSHPFSGPCPPLRGPNGAISSIYHHSILTSDHPWGIGLGLKI